MRHNRFVEWPHHDGRRRYYSSILSAPLQPLYNRR